MKLKFLLLLFLCCTLMQPIFAQAKQYSFAEIDSLQKQESRKVLVFIHTDWCHYCQQMKQHTFKNKDLVALMEQHFYFVMLNAESKEDIYFNEHLFKFKPNGNGTGLHELAAALANINGQVSYPSIVIINEKKELTFQYNQAIKAKALIGLLQELK
jgi:thioredoxin-related protein